MPYNLYPTYPLPLGQIQAGFDALAAIIASAVQAGAQHIALDGYGGVRWSELRAGLESALAQRDLHVAWRDTTACFLPEAELSALLAEYLGGDDPLFGHCCDLDLLAFFDLTRLQALAQPVDHQAVLIYGVGAALAAPPDFLLYVDLPKDEIQRAQSANLGTDQFLYKRCYFVDWPVLNRHKALLLPNLDTFIDGQNPARPTFIAGADLRSALDLMSVSCFRARPWFAPGPWGGQWMKQHFPGLDPDMPNYAWSFELIAPENGLVFANPSGGEQLECSFDLLMFQSYRAVLGEAAARFGYEFPIRFDYLDTMDGGNLSVQVHPRPDYIRQHFGETFTQDESYYITTCEPGAQVYLGFCDEVDPAAFHQTVEHAQRSGLTIDIDQFVNHVPAHPHDLFLIPNGTIHGSGANNLVLEISATPYIYTFKIYDWQRRDLQGNFRPLNLERAWENLYFERQQAYVDAHLTPQPTLLREGDGWREVLVGTHDALFYTVHRYEFTHTLSASTENRCHILNVVAGDGLIVTTASGFRAQFSFAETFVIPAAAKHYTLTPLGDQPCQVVFAFVK